MSRDYKPTARRTAPRKSAGSLLLGIFIGLLLGLGIALGLAWYITSKMPSPFIGRDKPAESKPDKAPQAKTETAKPGARETEPSADTQAKSAETKPRFDFYRILPGTEEPLSEQDLKQAAKQPQPAEIYFLQAGSFQSASDADNLKAKLALLGVEATIQTAILPDKGVWHRVRVGPYKKIEDLERIRTTLKQNGIDASLIKAREAQ